MSFFSGSLFGTVAIIALLAAVTIIVYCQIGWLLTSAWHKKDPTTWDGDCRVVGSIFWPFVCLYVYVLGPGCRGFIRLVTGPQRLMELKKERRERRAGAARRKQEEERVKPAEAETATSPAAEILKINDEMVKLANRKADLERRPDSNRH